MPRSEGGKLARQKNRKQAGVAGVLMFKGQRDMRFCWRVRQGMWELVSHGEELDIYATLFKEKRR